MFVALDANVWIRERLLRSAAGAAVLFVLRNQGHKLLIPSVTRDEAVAGVVRLGRDSRAAVDKELLTIRSITGSAPAMTLPSDEEIREAAATRFAEFGDLAAPVDLDLIHFERALERVIEHRPPAVTREEYRDCLLWEVVIDHARDGVALVTGDKGFYDSDPADALAEELADGTRTQREIAKRVGMDEGGTSRFFKNLRDLQAVDDKPKPTRMAEV